MLSTAQQIFWLVILPIPISCVAWTVTHEEVFREARQFCEDRSKHCRTAAARKFFYLFTCEYCFSHWVTVAFLVMTRFKLLLPDWKGYVISLFALVWLANIYMSLYSRLRVDIRSERAEAQTKEKQAKKIECEIKEAAGGHPGEDQPAPGDRRSTTPAPAKPAADAMERR
jgi:hypothetical protein